MAAYHVSHVPLKTRLAAFLLGPRHQRELHTPTKNICHVTRGEKPASSTGPQEGKSTSPSSQLCVEEDAASSSSPCAVLLSERCRGTAQAQAEANPRATRRGLSWPFFTRRATAATPSTQGTTTHKMAAGGARGGKGPPRLAPTAARAPLGEPAT